MSKFHVKMDGNSPKMDEITYSKEKALKKKAIPVSVKLSKNVLAQMKQQAGLQGAVSDENILHAFIVTKLSAV
jgi:hypothetical protein